MRPSFCILWLLILAGGLMPMVHAQTPPNPTTEQLILMSRTQPAVDVSAPVTATASFDPPAVRPGEKSIYRVTFDATEVSVTLPETIAGPSPLALRRSVSGQTMQATAGGMRMLATFNYDARTTQPGVFTVPAFTAQVYGKPVVVPAARLTVSAGLPAAHEPVRQLIVETSATNLFVGESFNVSVRLPATPTRGVEAVSQLQVNGDGFMVDKNAVRQTIQNVEQNGRQVPTFIYETRVTAISAGALKLSAQGFTSGMQFGGQVIISGQAVISGAPPEFLLLESEPVTLQVRLLPSESELPGFTGMVGDDTCDPPSLATNVLRVGEPVTLTVVIRSQQNLNRINPPPPPKVAGWQIFPATRGASLAGTNGRDPGASFSYTLIPLSAALSATPAIPFSSFDPTRGQYVNLTIPPVPVLVMSNQTQIDSDAALILSGNASEPEKATSLSRLAAAPGRRTSSLVPLQLRPWFPFVQVLPALGFCGLWWWDRRRRFLEQHPELVRRRQARRALRREIRLLDAAASQGDAAGFIRCAINALQIAAAPHYPATPRALVGTDVLQLLTGPERNGPSGEMVRRFFAAADAATFATTTESHAELLTEQAALKELLAQLEARL